MGCCTPDINSPDYAQASWDAALADIKTLPKRKAIEAAAQRGEKITIDGQTYDFTGLGEADYQAANMRAIAGSMLDMEQKYGPAYVQQRLDELKAADPEGYQIRKDLWDSIQSDLKAAGQETRPTATTLEQTVLGELNKGATLSPEIAREVSQGVRRKQAALGQTLGAAATTEEANAVVGAADALRTQRQQAALQFLTTGVSPEDTAYRRTQQGMANLGSFISGETPTAQFRQLTGAQNQAVPFISGPTGLGVNNAAGPQGQQFAFQNWQAQTNYNQSQVNPWLAGLATGVNTARTGLAFSG